LALFATSAAAGVPGGCGSGGDDETGGPATSTSPPQARAVLSLESFRTPSRDIYCAMVEGIARCDIRERDWSPPPKPADCELDWGQGISVKRTGAAGFVCTGDTTYNPDASVLAYGKVSKVGPLRCASRKEGVTCTNAEGRGFFISRNRYRLF
jgi:hypothetical protein